MQVYGVACLTGVGFTMSLFIGSLAFTSSEALDQVRLGVLMGSVASGLLGFTVLLPLYIRTATGDLRYIQDLIVRGDQTEFDFRVDEMPVEVVLDPFRSVLRR